MKKQAKTIIFIVIGLLVILLGAYTFIATRNYGEKFDAQTLPLLEEMDNAQLFTPDLLKTTIEDGVSMQEAAKKTSGKNIYLTLYKNKVQELVGDEEYGSWSSNPDTRLDEQYKSIDVANELMFSTQSHAEDPKLFKYTQEQMNADVKSIDAALVYTKFKSHSLFRKAWCKKYGLIYYLGCGKSKYETNPKLALSPIPKTCLDSTKGKSLSNDWKYKGEIFNSSSQEIQNLILKTQDLPNGWRISVLGERCKTDIGDEYLKLGWKGGYYIDFINDNSGENIEIVVSNYPKEVMDKVVGYPESDTTTEILEEKEVEVKWTYKVSDIENIADTTKLYSYKKEYANGWVYEGHLIDFSKGDYDATIYYWPQNNIEFLKEIAKKQANKL